MTNPPSPSITSRFMDFWRVFRRNKMGLVGLIMLVIIVFVAVFADVIAPYDVQSSMDVTTSDIYKPPSAQHWLGTDDAGKDEFSNFIFGARVSLIVGFFAAFISIFIGGVLGIVAGFFGGRIENILMRVTDIMLTLPTLFVAILLTQLLRAGVVPFLSAGIVPIVLVIAVTSWMGVARVVRASFLSLKEKDFVDAARAAGARNQRIMVRHILPNAMSPIIVAATLRVGAAIITESGLSYLGFGVQPPIPTWGNMLRNAQSEMDYAPWTAIFPGLFIFITVIAANYIGDGLRDALDPHHVER